MMTYAWAFFRFYQALTNRGGGKQDTPGKLAHPTSVGAATFDDIQGMDDAKLEVMELVDTLRNPNKYEILGARAPKGLLMEGPPGTGAIIFLFVHYCFHILSNL